MASRNRYDYCSHLAHEALHAEGLPKGERTKLRVKAAAARILAEKGFHELRMADVATEAKLSHGAAYRYFKNKKELAFDVLQGQGEWAMGFMLPAPGGSVYERVLHSTSEMVEHFRANVGLMRCLRQLGDELPEFDRLVLANNAEWYRLVASGLARRAGTTADARNETYNVVAALGGMVDEMLHNVFVREDPHLKAYRRAPDRLAVLLAVLWYRGAYAENPPAEEVGAHPLLDLQGDG